MSVVYLDCETTGLDPSQHEVWEIALIEEDGTEHEWRLKPQRLVDAQPDALRITGFYERIAAAGYHEETIEEGYPKRQTTVKRANFWTPQSRASIAREVATLTSGKHLVGAVPSFDANFLHRFLRGEGYTPAWHYHLVDCEALVAGRLMVPPPWDTRELSRLIGVPQLDGKHTALGDARFAKAMYEAAFDPRETRIAPRKD